MDEGILVELSSAIRHHPWWHARAGLTLDLLVLLGIHPPARVLDAGCGWGVTLEALERKGYRTFGLDVSRRMLEQLDQECRQLIEADLTRPLPNVVTPFDAVLALDVIEHLDDDRGAVERLGQLARPGGGVVIVSVPAQPELFSDFDVIQGHRRRYQAETLRSAFAGTGLELERLFWWGAWMLPVLKWQRRRPRSMDGNTPAERYSGYLRVPSWPGPWMLRIAYALEKPLALGQQLKTGTSLFAVARRP